MKRDLKQVAFEFIAGYAMLTYPDRGIYTISVINTSVAPYPKQYYF